MNSEKYIHEINRIQNLIEFLTVDNEAIIKKEILPIIDKLQKILKEIYDDVKTYKTVKKELMKLDYELHMKMDNRNLELIDILNSTKILINN